MKATDQANAIAALLQNRFKKDAAAKALALMNAHNYAGAIAAILKDKEPLNRCAALLALGIMQAKDYEDQVVAHLEDPEEFVRPYAAWGIIMMESQKHAPKALKLAEASKGILSVEGQGAAEIAIKEFRQVFDRAEESFNRMKQARCEEKAVSKETMTKIYEQIKTPYKYGIILKGKPGEKVDCPSVFRHGKKWYMVYIIFDGSGYETAIAESTDLINWKKSGKILKFKKEQTWDRNQVAGYIALQDHNWGGSYKLQTYDEKYWLSYIGGALKGYETGPLAIGIAWTKNPTKPVEWNRIKENPILHPYQPDAREFETGKLYKSNIIWDKDQSLGYPFVMFYNAKHKPTGVERIGMAVSNDMIHWKRFGDKPVIDNFKGISGDPQITKIGDVWVMFYFGAFWKPKAFDTFACSYDLVNWTKWDGPDLIEPSEPWDKKYAHKPWMIKHRDIVYHFYCAVGDQGRAIALATSKPLKP
jgi:predicted GH43/DUF377 family glycosyl hydrolase